MQNRFNDAPMDMEAALEALKVMMNLYSVRYITIDTKFTKHHLEKVAGTNSDRGRWKWIGETKMEAFEEMAKDKEAQKSHIDGGDMFPRFYFLNTSFINEFREWLKARDLKITDMEAPQL